jgi:hypothetical protein
MLMLLLVVLPLHSVIQLVAGVQGHRHVHRAAAPQASSQSPLRALLDQLHALQDPRLQGPKFGWMVSHGPAGEVHEHGGVFHRHGHDDPDVVDVGDPADDDRQGGVTAFLAWLPAALGLPAGESDSRPLRGGPDWLDRVVAPPLTPPRG